MLKARLLLLTTLSLGLAQAAIVLPGDPNWLETGVGGNGSAEITADRPHNGSGSVRLTGDRVRFINGNPWGAATDTLLSEVNAFRFDWLIDATSVSSLHPDYTPALRLHFWDAGAAANQYSELIWEGAYNGVYGSVSPDTWYTTANDDNFWRWVTGVGPTTNPGLIQLPVTGWAASAYYSNPAYVQAISLGVGSSVGDGYLAFADNVTFGVVGAAATSYNFETAPEPATWGLIGGGLLIFWALRRRLA